MTELEDKQAQIIERFKALLGVAHFNLAETQLALEQCQTALQAATRNGSAPAVQAMEDDGD